MGLENFLLNCSSLPGVHTIGLFDCCRRNKNKLGNKLVIPGGGYTSIISIYREAHSEFQNRECPCPADSPSMIEEFFNHVSTK